MSNVKVPAPIDTEDKSNYRKTLALEELNPYVPKGFVGHKLFPRVKTKRVGSHGYLFKFGNDELQLLNTFRLPGTDIIGTDEVPTLKPLHLDSHGIMGSLPIELAEHYGGKIDYDTLVLMDIFRKMSLRLEYDQAKLARDSAMYASSNKTTLTGSSQWSHDESSPKNAIKVGRQAIRNQIGFYPNVAIVSDKAFSALQDHPEYSSVEFVTPSFLAERWDIEAVFIAKAAYKDGAGFVDVWGGDVVLAYTVSDDFPDLLNSNYGCTYTDEEGFVFQKYFNEKTRCFSYNLADYRNLIMNNPNSAYLIKNAVSE